MTYQLIESCGLLHLPETTKHEPEPASEEDLLLVHSEEYLKVVQGAGTGKPTTHPWYHGLGTGDNPIFPDMYEASTLTVGGSVLATRLVASSEARVAFNIGGGLHHAHRDRAAGFCIFNDPAVAIACLLRDQAEGTRIVYLDLDAHHGDGVQEQFYLHNDVLTLSIHESGRFLFPGTGEVNELGRGVGRGYSVNLPLAPYTDDETYLWAFDQIVPPLVASFQPHFVVVQLGVDSHHQDPLTHLALTTHGILALVERVCQLPGRLIAVGGGGYNLEVVARAWTIAFAALSGLPVPREIPGSLRAQYTSFTLHDQAPPSLPAETGMMRAFARESVDLVKCEIFPYHDL